MSLFRFLRRKSEPEENQVSQEAPAKPSPSLAQRLGERLARTRNQLRGRLSQLFSAGRAYDPELREELEDLLLGADVGIAATQHILDQTEVRLKEGAQDPETALQQAMCALLEPLEAPLTVDLDKKPYVILVIGVNGSGKTTTIGKLARALKDGGHSVMLAAGDTFRAAAVEQLAAWGERNAVPVIAQGQGADSAAVIFDALQSARARNIDVVIADTAGRLHNNSGLMNELTKVKRVIAKFDPQAPHETLLVLDGGTGQNALQQARLFHQAADVSGLCVTKLDGTARGGVLFSIAAELGLPVRYIGVGEGVEDLRVFQASAYVEAIAGGTGHAE